jgi:hypothetical protein
VISRTVEAIQGGHSSEEEGKGGVEKAGKGRLGKGGVLGLDQRGLVASFEGMCNIASDKKGRLSGATGSDRLSLYAYFKQVRPSQTHTKVRCLRAEVARCQECKVWKYMHLCREYVQVYALLCAHSHVSHRRRRAETVRHLGQG